LLVIIAVAPAAAQQGDINAIYKRFQAFYDADNYPAALVEAEKYEAAVKVRFGINHADYGTALNNLAGVNYLLGKHADAEGLYRRALAIREKALGAGHLAAIRFRHQCKLRPAHAEVQDTHLVRLLAQLLDDELDLLAPVAIVLEGVLAA
jgi:tetratricopeptide (TPR) repeat protein